MSAARVSKVSVIRKKLLTTITAINLVAAGTAKSQLDFLLGSVIVFSSMTRGFL